MTREPLRALVVDDAPTVRLYHGEILRGLDFVVDEAGNGLEALELAMLTRYDLLLVDVNMPLMDGYTLLGRLREDDVACSAPIVMISTEAEVADADAAYHAGANMYLVKPVAPDVLTRVATTVTATLTSTSASSS